MSVDPRCCDKNGRRRNPGRGKQDRRRNCRTACGNCVGRRAQIRRAAGLVDSSAALARCCVIEAKPFCRSRTGLSGRSRAFTSKRLVVAGARGKFALAEEKRRRSRQSESEVWKSLGQGRSENQSVLPL